MKEDDIDEKEIMKSFSVPVRMKIFSWKGNDKHEMDAAKSQDPSKSVAVAVAVKLSLRCARETYWVKPLVLSSLVLLVKHKAPIAWDRTPTLRSTPCMTTSKLSS